MGLGMAWVVVISTLNPWLLAEKVNGVGGKVPVMSAETTFLLSLTTSSDNSCHVMVSINCNPV